MKKATFTVGQAAVEPAKPGANLLLPASLPRSVHSLLQLLQYRRIIQRGNIGSNLLALGQRA